MIARIARWIVNAVFGEEVNEPRFYCHHCGCYVLIPTRHLYHGAVTAGALPS